MTILPEIMPDGCQNYQPGRQRLTNAPINDVGEHPLLNEVQAIIRRAMLNAAPAFIR